MTIFLDNSVPYEEVSNSEMASLGGVYIFRGKGFFSFFFFLLVLSFSFVLEVKCGTNFRVPPKGEQLRLFK